MARFIVTVLIFVLLGPVIGGLTFGTVFPGIDAFHWTFLLFSYLIGGLPALAAGIVIGLVQMWRGAVGAVVTLIVGSAVGVAVVLFMGGIRAADRINWYLVATFFACVVSTFACWGIVKAIHRQPSPVAGTAP